MNLRKETRTQRKTARKKARQTKKKARQTARAEKKTIRSDRKSDLKEIRQSDQAKTQKKSAKKKVRTKAKSNIKAANTSKKTKVKTAKENLKEKLSNLTRIKGGKKNWHSYLKFIENKAKNAYSPANTAEVKRIVEYAVASKRRVKMVGSGHSFSKILANNDILVHPESLCKIKTFTPLECQRRFKKRSDKVRANNETLTMVEIEAGATIRNIDNSLERKGLGLLNQGTYEGQRLWGAISTSTHGSGVALPPFPDMVVSVVVVVDTRDGVKAIRFERSDGPTRDDFKERDVDEIVKSDAAFNSIICSMGTMGIATKITVLARRFYYLHEYGDLLTWTELKKKLTPGKLDKLLNEQRHYEFAITSNKTDNEIKMPKFSLKKGGAIYDLRANGFAKDYVATEVKRRDITNKASFKEQGELPIALMLSEAKGVPQNQLHPFAKKDQKISQHASLKVLTNLLSGMLGFEARDAGAIAVISPYADKKNGLDPSYNFKRKYYHVFPRGGKKIGGYGFEVAAPYKQVVPVMDEILRLANKVTKEINNNLPPKVNKPFFSFGPIGVRFVEASNAYLSPQYLRRSVMFEITITQKNLKRRNDLQLKGMKRLQNLIMSSAKLKPLGIRIHWGLELDQIDANYVTRTYKRLATFKKQRALYNAHGTFNNSFSKRVGLDL